jgi:hypothetical protein
MPDYAWTDSWSAYADHDYECPKPSTGSAGVVVVCNLDGKVEIDVSLPGQPLIQLETSIDCNPGQELSGTLRCINGYWHVIVTRDGLYVFPPQSTGVRC